MKILERGDIEEGFEFERAWITMVDGRPAPVALVGGILCNIETKETLLDAGIAFCQPVDPEWAANWPLSLTIDVQPGDPPLHANCVTANERIVAAARRFHELALADQATEGTPL
jgi:hypothetical protein